MKSPQVSAEATPILRYRQHCDFNMNHLVRAQQDKRNKNCQAQGTQASRRLSSPALGESMRRAPLPEPDRAQVARGPSGKVRLAQSPAGRGTPRLSLGHRGAQPARAPSAQPQQSSTGRDEKKQQPPHKSGRTRGKLELPRFPQLRTAGNGNDATRGSLPASTATRKSGREAAGTPSLGHCPPPPRPAPPAPPATPIGPSSTN